MVDYMADYLAEVSQYPVKSQVKPGEIYKQLPDHPPAKSQSIDAIIEDFTKILLPGITHWQHPNFHAYFTGNSSYPSVLAEMLTATIGAQCMLWETSPAATELEEKMMDWLKEMLGLPEHWKGVIQDTASTATLVAIISAREKRSQWLINQRGYHSSQKFTVYCSEQAHSSVDKAVRIAGIGIEYLRKVEVDQAFAMKPEALELAVKQDLEAGFTPLLAIATLGTTGCTAVDPIEEIAHLCQKHQLWLHIDAAWAGTALILPEYRWMIKGIDQADSFVFNPHKWMFTNFDCSAYFVKDQQILIRTFAVVPEYLKTKTKEVNNYSEWGIQLGRRFRALKLWFVIRNFGVDGLKEKIAAHLSWTEELAEEINRHSNFELILPSRLGCICFRFSPPGLSESQLDLVNRNLMDAINASGRLYLTHTTLNDTFAIRMVIGQTYQTREDIQNAWNTIQEISETIKS